VFSSISFLKSPIIIVRNNVRSRSCFSCVMACPRRIWFWWCQVTLVSVASVLMLASCHLIISSAYCLQYIWLDPVLPVILVDSGLLRVQLSLWSRDSGILWTWDSWCVRVLGSQASSKTLRYRCDHLLGCWDPGILRSWACYRTWKWYLLWGPWDCPLCLKPR
jgi:hypothetical protein